MADTSQELQLEDAELDTDERANIDYVNKVIDAAKISEETGLDEVRNEIGEEDYFITLRWAYSYHVNDIYFECRSILSSVPITYPPNQLLEIVNRLWGEKPLTPEEQELKDRVLPDLVTLRILRRAYLEEASIRKAQKLDKLAIKYFPPEITYGDIYEIRTLLKVMIASLPDLENIKAQFLLDAESLLKIKRENVELEDEYIIKIINELFNYELLTDIAGLVQDLVKAKDENRIDLQAASELAPGYILDLAVIQDEKMRTLEHVVQNTEINTIPTAPTALPQNSSGVIKTDITSTQNDENATLDIV